MNSIHMTVWGDPAPKGSRGAAVNKAGKVHTWPASKKLKPWTRRIENRAAVFMVTHDEFKILDCPLQVTIYFWFKRPKCHYRTGKNSEVLKPSAPNWVMRTPDIDKLVRAVLDPLTGRIWKDDSLVVKIMASKEYTEDPSCASIIIEGMS